MRRASPTFAALIGKYRAQYDGSPDYTSRRPLSGTESAEYLAKLFQFTTDFQQKLPREVRDMVHKTLCLSLEAKEFYTLAILTKPDTFRSITSYHAQAVAKEPPVFAQPGEVDKCFGQDFTEMFYPLLLDFAVLDPATIGTYLKKDFFPASEYVQAPRLAPGFKLVVYLTATWAVKSGQWKRNKNKRHEGGSCVSTLVSTLGNLKLVAAQLHAKCETAEMHVHLGVSVHKSWGVTAEMMDYDERLWLEELTKIANRRKPERTRQEFLKDLRSNITFTKRMRDKLPRELRDIVCSYMLDQETVHKMHNATYDYKVGTVIGHHPPPALLLRVTIHEEIRAEIVEAFCGLDPFISIAHPRDIQGLMDKDLFFTGVQPKHCRLSALAIYGSILDKQNASINLDTFLAELALFLRTEQRLSPTYTLKFAPSTHYPPSDSGTLPESNGGKVHHIQVPDLIIRLRALEPVFKSLREVLGKERKVVLELNFSGTTYPRH
ncbi:hypothetical protein CC86DRAFT_403692 [Ophiobolus disseminans]|uniref:Uncharacterized protein n=1 Tax=Ophiobolus disseminans TaxID=1469910 RepID=A0A6A7A798_9PLEO|nr:hypothetical protein CC86DRAFT_403692 [Ophiobolus disseminans]